MIGDAIKRERLSKGWSQEELALMVGYNGRSTISKIEKNERDIPQKKIIEFAKAFGCTPGELIGADFSVRLDNETEILVEKYEGLSEEEKQRVMKFIEILETTR